MTISAGGGGLGGAPIRTRLSWLAEPFSCAVDAGALLEATEAVGCVPPGTASTRIGSGRSAVGATRVRFSGGVGVVEGEDVAEIGSGMAGGC